MPLLGLHDHPKPSDCSLELEAVIHLRTEHAVQTYESCGDKACPNVLMMRSILPALLNCMGILQLLNRGCKHSQWASHMHASRMRLLECQVTAEVHTAPG